MESKSSSLGQKIKRYRLVNDIRQEDMAENIGVSRATLINYEKGHTTINIDVLNRLNEFYPDFEFEATKDIKPKIIFENSIDFLDFSENLNFRLTKEIDIVILIPSILLAGFGSHHLRVEVRLGLELERGLLPVRRRRWRGRRRGHLGGAAEEKCRFRCENAFFASKKNSREASMKSENREKEERKSKKENTRLRR